MRSFVPVGVSLAASVVLAACYTPTVARTNSYHPSDADVSVTRIVHGSVLIDFHDTRILVDPWFLPTPPLGMGEPIGLAAENLPPVGGILITHKHDDHFDERMLREYANKGVRVVARRGLGERIRKLGYKDVVEVEDWEQTEIGSVIVMAVPARHREPENGYVLQANGVTAYVAGDTLFDAELFASIANVFRKIDVALLPIGGIRILGRKLDMSPDEAAAAFAILKASFLIPFHYALAGPFPFITSASEPVQSLAYALAAQGPEARAALVVLQPGESWHHYR